MYDGNFGGKEAGYGRAKSAEVGRWKDDGNISGIYHYHV